MHKSSPDFLLLEKISHIPGQMNFEPISVILVPVVCVRGYAHKFVLVSDERRHCILNPKHCNLDIAPAKGI